MSDRIKLLPEIVANQIAAGEVVEEPAAAVKEMMENAIDAGARCVKVNYRNGGLDLIQIIDDGCGMSPIDARMAFDRHTTSKISTFDDIYALRTFGFRGEALASISAISQVELRTRQAEDEVGTETIINGGEFVSQRPVMTPVGSNFVVRNLFYNAPARRKYLPKLPELASRIKTEFQRVALCYPDVAFELYANDLPLVTLPPSSLGMRIVNVIGERIKSNLLEVNADTSIVRINGFVGRPAVAKKRNSEQYFFVNGRFFKSSYMNKAVLKAYEKLIPESYFPSYFIYITVDPERVDVNVSPRKTEVKFADTENIWQILHAAVRETLAKTGAVPMMDFDNESDIEIPPSHFGGAIYAEPRSAVNEHYNPFEIDNDSAENSLADIPSSTVYSGGVKPVRNVSSGMNERAGLHPDDGFSLPSGGGDMFEEFEEFESSAGFGREQELPVAVRSSTENEHPKFASAAYIGNGYASALYGGKFIIADLRRARERILYDGYVNMMNNMSSVSQQLLFPEKLVLSNEEYALLEENIVEFEKLGFEIGFEGDGAVTVKGVPAETGSEGVDELLFELLKALDMPVKAEELMRERLASAMARSGAAGTPRNLTNEDAALLLDRLAACENVSFTPSGKTIITEITVDDIRSRLG